MNIENQAFGGKEELLEIEGIVDHVIFQNENNGYTVCEMESSDGEYLTLVGITPFLAEGESIKALGRWELHASFGRQFKVEYYEKQMPASASAILKYLSSGAIKGIGPILASRIVERFGEETFEIIEHNPEWLADIEGITVKKAKKIGEQFRASFGVRSVMMHCRDYFGPATAVKVYQKWGGSALDIIEQNPYALCDAALGISFETADRMAADRGGTPDAPKRVEAGLIYFLKEQASRNGHTFLPAEKLTEAAARFLSVSEEAILTGCETLLQEGRLVEVTYHERRVLYLKEYFEAERYIAAKLDSLHRQCPRTSLRDADRFVTQLEAEMDITYAKRQREAIVSVLDGGVTVLTGGPGTGKTTVIRAVLAVFSRMGLTSALAAPTGRAAKRMSEATSKEAKTIHRLLEMEYADGAEPVFRRTEYDLLDEDVIIIDEASMVDTLLFCSLLKAIKPGARLLLIGDADQLPSVGAGQVLLDVMESGVFPSVRLTEIFRQSEKSLIVKNAHAINRGEYPNLKEKDGDFFFLSRGSAGAIAETVAELCATRLPKRYGPAFAEGIQVITPTHRGEAGTENLNALLQRVLNPASPDKREHKLRERVFRVGDKVMQTKNNYDIAWERNGVEGVGIFNGDIGVITAISQQEESVEILFDDRRAVYDFSQVAELELAYAITVHKSQGSEYPVVLLPLSDGNERLATRNLLYTAVTRAKDMVIVIGREETLGRMVDNDRQVRRYTGLSMLLAAYREDLSDA